MGFICTNCNTEAKFFCGRCKVECYCSPLCQKLAFPQHRFSCFNLPTLMPLEGFKQAFFDVVVNHLTMLEYNDGPRLPDTEYKALVNMKVPALEPNKAKKPEQAGGITSAKTSLDNEEIAGLPEAPKPEKKQAPVEIEKKQAPVEAEKKQAPVEIRKTREPVEVTAIPDKQKTAIPADLGVAETPVKVHKTEMGMGAKKKTWVDSFKSKVEAKPEPPKPEAPKRIFYSDLGYREFKNGEHTVTIVGGETEAKLLYVMEYFDGLEKFMADIEKGIKEAVVKETSKIYEPVMEEMVLAKFEGIYYRAVVTEIKGETYKVLFIDYGNTETVQATDIKRFPEVLKMDVVIQEVFMENLPTPLTKKAAALISSESGIKVKVDGYTETGSYKATLIGL